MEIRKILVVFLVFSLVFSLYLSSAGHVVFDVGSYDVVDSDTVLELVGFFKSENKIPAVFDKRESAHLIDVKELIVKGGALLMFLILADIVLLSLLFFYSRRDVSKVFVFSGIFGLVLPVPLLLLRFSDLFFWFHSLFFTPGSWRFDAGSALIKLFPEQFFYDAFVRIIVGSVLFSIVFILIGFFLSGQGGD